MSENIGSACCQISRPFLNNALDQFKAEHQGILLQSHDNLFSDIAILISSDQMAQMRGVINAVEKVVALQGWKQAVLHDKNYEFVPSCKGVFFGYDFHLNEVGAHLIEINTNAGGAILADMFQRSQEKASLPGQSLDAQHLPRVFTEMFRHEWKLQRGNEALRCIAIVDESPKTQYFYPEFVMIQQLFEAAGIKAFIADPAEFTARADGLYLEEYKIDLIYNRLTDFSLQQYPSLFNAYAANQVVLTPHPYAYALYADKRNLALLTDENRLREMGADETSIATLIEGVPQTRLVQGEDEPLWWKERKEWFFKPATGYGGRGSYRGDKLTQRVFSEIMQGGYVAQRKAMPGEVKVSVAGAEPAVFKYDVRCYVYEGQVQSVVARLYQGQTTNFRTPGGGFALVRLAG